MGIFNSDILQIGSICTCSVNNLPSGYLECNGASLLRADYPDLFTAITSAWGAADSTHFNLPDLRGRFLRGWSHEATVDPDRNTRTACNTGGNTGNNVGSIQTDLVKGHTTHTYLVRANYKYTDGSGSGANYKESWGGVSYTGYSGGNETRPLNAYVMYVIKYK